MADQMVTCKNCGNQFTGRYCNSCGEKVYTEHDKSILHFFEEASHFLTHFEGTFFTTIKTIFSKPGKLSLDYCNGLRKKYFKPLPLFMLLVVLYLIFPFFVGLNMPFEFYLSKGSYANKMITKKTSISMDSIFVAADASIDSRNLSSDKMTQLRWRYADSAIREVPELLKIKSAFNKKSEKISKVLLLILLPLTAIVCWILSLRSRKYFFDHLVLSTELNSFYLLLSFFLVPLLVTLLYKIIPASANLISDFRVGAFSYTIVGIFSAVAFRRFYGDRWWWSAVKAIILICAHFIIVQVIYKFILFALTFSLST